MRASEEKYRLLFDSGNDGIAVNGIFPDGTAGNYLEVNPAFCKLLGYTNEELYELTPYDVIDTDYDLDIPTMTANFLHNKHIRFELGYIAKTGEKILVEANCQLFQFKCQLCILSINRDITDRKKSQETLLLMKKSIDISSDNVFWCTPEGRIVYVNDEGCRELGYEHDDLLNLTVFDVNPILRKETGRWAAVWSQLRETHYYNRESLHQRKDGSVFAVDIHCTYVSFGGQEYCCGIAHDISARKASEEQILREHQELQQVLDSVVAQIWYLDTDARAVKCNRVAEVATGIPGSEVTGKTIHTLAPGWDDVNLRHQESILVANTGQPLLGSIESFQLDDGEVKWASVDKLPWRDANGTIIGVLMFIYEITNRKQAEDALRESEEKFRHIVENSQDGLALSDEDGRIIEWNPGQEEISGIKRDDALGKTAWDLQMQMMVEEDRTPENEEHIKEIILDILKIGILPGKEKDILIT
ncbi:MAG TPA: PAS domain S-box protein [Candidatus Lokiarchaeia archaeon]|nr:PAS domain S-box protein [Candidatus Lokiarchaeia archaeon]